MTRNVSERSGLERKGRIGREGNDADCYAVESIGEERVLFNISKGGEEMLYEFEQLEERLKDHDWTYIFSDSHQTYLAGEESSKKIHNLFWVCSRVDKSAAIALYNKYANREGGLSGEVILNRIEDRKEREYETTKGG